MNVTGIVLPILNPPPSSLPTPSLWVVPVHQPQASSIMHRTWTGDSKKKKASTDPRSSALRQIQLTTATTSIRPKA